MHVGSMGALAGLAVVLATATSHAEESDWSYDESYRRTEDGVTTEQYDRSWHGFFGGCRALIGLQVRVAGRFKLGSEAVFAFLNYMELKSGNQRDYSFQFPMMKWNITARYELF